MLWFSNSSWSHMAVLNLLRDKETDREKKLFTCFQMILVVFQIFVAGGVEGFGRCWRERMKEIWKDACKQFQSYENEFTFSHLLLE